MIKEIIIENIRVGESDEVNKIVGRNAQGKVLKVFVKFSDEERSNAHLKLITKEGEDILNIHNRDEKRALYYPRASIESGKYKEDNFGSGEKDYFYFLNGLLLSIKMDNPNFEGIVIDKIRIVYED